MYETEDKMVSHPPHYQSETGMEVIDVIEAFTADLKGIEATDTGNVIKYICRWKHKNGLQDLEKARWYLDHLIEHVAKLEEENSVTMEEVVAAERISDAIKVFRNPRCVDKETIDNALDQMLSLVETYGCVSVADMYDLMGLQCSYVWNKCGWANLDDASVIELEDGMYELVLPKPIILEQGE